MRLLDLTARFLLFEPFRIATFQSMFCWYHDTSLRIYWHYHMCCDTLFLLLSAVHSANFLTLENIQKCRLLLLMQLSHKEVTIASYYRIRKERGGFIKKISFQVNIEELALKLDESTKKIRRKSSTNRNVLLLARSTLSTISYHIWFRTSIKCLWNITISVDIYLDTSQIF